MYVPDETDLEIIRLLRKNARLQWREVGELVHLTGQAVGARIRRLEEHGLIRGYTVMTDDEKLGKPLTAVVTVLMKSNRHAEFISFVQREPSVTEAHRISGDGCYSLLVRASGHDELNGMLDRLLEYANYRLHLSTQLIKSHRH
ncbi:Lrp/AsnC family transcriptional regulator [Paenibacillus chartarius]|uniref:Lrp/AsnC family transcriptional regulator n=1 Tax=Paenibacillus chartarius TaxID=747481 RepID=A0ABV6DV20_9BACL